MLWQPGQTNALTNGADGTDLEGISSHADHKVILKKIKRNPVWCRAELALQREGTLAGRDAETAQSYRAAQELELKRRVDSRWKEALPHGGRVQAAAGRGATPADPETQSNSEPRRTHNSSSHTVLSRPPPGTGVCSGAWKGAPTRHGLQREHALEPAVSVGPGATAAPRSRDPKAWNTHESQEPFRCAEVRRGLRLRCTCTWHPRRRPGRSREEVARVGGSRGGHKDKHPAGHSENAGYQQQTDDSRDVAAAKALKS